MYDYIVVGAGISGATFARLMTDQGKKCLVVESRSHIGGNIYDKMIEGILVHQYGAHIFHTDNQEVLSFVQRFTELNHFIASPIANYKGEYFNLPFNMNTFYKLWGTKTPQEVKLRIAQQVADSGITEPKNLEEQAIMLVGYDLYEKLIKGYTEKQWGKPCKELPADIIRRLPVRFTYDNNYYNHPYQGIPKEGYTKFIETMLAGIEVQLNTDFLANQNQYFEMGKRVFYTGTIDGYYDYCFGSLAYRSLRFETEILDTENYQGNYIINFTDKETPYTRLIEHKHFHFCQDNSDKTVITREYPDHWTLGKEPYYSMNDDENMALYAKYKAKSEQDERVIFGGRLGQYQYYDMDKAILDTMQIVKAQQ